MKLYIINECCRGSVYGIGTYVRELTTILRNSKIDVYVINLNSEKNKLSMKRLKAFITSISRLLYDGQ